MYCPNCGNEHEYIEEGYFSEKTDYIYCRHCNRKTCIGKPQPVSQVEWQTIDRSLLLTAVNKMERWEAERPVLAAKRRLA